ncbi:MAG: hypothetical protein K8L91_24620 [Anaerolineae bacterium]|nr:hypothetical protein [Anaerolineae bacterium]
MSNWTENPFIDRLLNSLRIREDSRLLSVEEAKEIRKRMGDKYANGAKIFLQEYLTEDNFTIYHRKSWTCFIDFLSGQETIMFFYHYPEALISNVIPHAAINFCISEMESFYLTNRTADFLIIYFENAYYVLGTAYQWWIKRTSEIFDLLQLEPSPMSIVQVPMHSLDADELTFDIKPENLQNTKITIYLKCWRIEWETDNPYRHDDDHLVFLYFSNIRNSTHGEIIIWDKFYVKIHYYQLDIRLIEA